MMASVRARYGRVATIAASRQRHCAYSGRLLRVRVSDASNAEMIICREISARLSL